MRTDTDEFECMEVRGNSAYACKVGNRIIIDTEKHTSLNRQQAIQFARQILEMVGED